MKFYLKQKDKLAWNKVLSNICGNLAAGWYGFILITSGFTVPVTIDQWIVLIRSVLIGILFTIASFYLERKSK
jgi:hypothetical protein